LIKGQLSQAFCGKGFFVFLFEEKEDRDTIFRNNPYFMGSKGMYLNRWTLDFFPEKYIPLVVSIWVCLPYLPLHYWNDNTICNIGKYLGKYIDRAKPRDGMEACARMCGG
jgi:hypothetical protein